MHFHVTSGFNRRTNPSRIQLPIPGVHIASLTGSGMGLSVHHSLSQPWYQNSHAFGSRAPAELMPRTGNRFGSVARLWQPGRNRSGTLMMG
jgi:hypothetical protein